MRNRRRRDNKQPINNRMGNWRLRRHAVERNRCGDTGYYVTAREHNPESFDVHMRRSPKMKVIKMRVKSIVPLRP